MRSQPQRELLSARRRAHQLGRPPALGRSPGSAASPQSPAQGPSPSALPQEQSAREAVNSAEVLLDELEAATERSVRIAGLKPGRENALLDELRELRVARHAWCEAVNSLSTAQLASAHRASEDAFEDLRSAYEAVTRERDAALSA